MLVLMGSTYAAAHAVCTAGGVIDLADDEAAELIKGRYGSKATADDVKRSKRRGIDVVNGVRERAGKKG